MHMQMLTHDTRIVLTLLTFAFALAVAVAHPLPAGATDRQNEFPMCWTGSYVSYLECVEINVETSRERDITTVGRLAIVPNTVTDYLYMEMNVWGTDFEFAPRTAPRLPIWDGASLQQNSIMPR
jgi:hypothetical protein